MMKIAQIKNTLFNWKELSMRKIVKRISFILGAIILFFILIFIFFPDPIINTFLKERITKALKESYPAYSIKFSDMHYNFWKNRLSSGIP